MSLASERFLLFFAGGSTTASGEGTSLDALSLDADEIEEGSAEDTVVGALQDTTGGSTLSLEDDAGGRFKLDGLNIVAGPTATDYGTATSHNITVRETLAEAVNSPRDSVISIAVTEAGGGPELMDSQYIPSLG